MVASGDDAIVGTDYVRANWRNASRWGHTTIAVPDVGIVASLDELAGPQFDPGTVDPAVREFYEHTTRFRLDIVPEWRIWVRPGYLLYRTLVAKPLGQANVPTNQRETLRGIRSRIDTITGGGDPGELVDDLHDSRVDPIRSPTTTSPSTWGSTRPTGATTGGYVSVGFPLPESNFTATLTPRARPGANGPREWARNGQGLVLDDRGALGQPGALPGLHRRPRPASLTTGGGAGVRGAARRVRRRTGELRAEHAFWVFGFRSSCCITACTASSRVR